MSHGSHGTIAGRVLRLERATRPGHLTIARLMQHARGDAPPPCDCPTCRGWLAALVVAAKRWREREGRGR